MSKCWENQSLKHLCWEDTCVGDASVCATCRLWGTACFCGTGGSVAEAACTTFRACWGIWTTWESVLGWTTCTCCTTAGWPGLCTISRLLPACKWGKREVSIGYSAHLEWGSLNGVHVCSKKTKWGSALIKNRAQNAFYWRPVEGSVNILISFNTPGI